MDLESLRVWVQAGHDVDYSFFWGHRQKQAGVTDASCLSQWFPAPFTVDGLRYRTAEHWMMVGKARLFEDVEMLVQILAANDPAQAKALGRKVRGFDQARWAAHRFDLVVEGNEAKFSAHEHLQEYLLGTGRSVLVEASPRDRIWGIGMGRNNPAASDPARWRGANLLGFALMEVRELLGGPALAD